MITNFLKKYKSNIILITFVTAFSILFPFSITIYKMETQKIKTYKPDMLGKSVILNTGNEKETIDVEMFIPLVLYSAMSDEYEEETLKSMIVIFRTYILNMMGENDSINAENLGIPYTTYSELEKKWGKKYEKKYMNTMKLLKETDNLVIVFNNELIYPYYNEISAGITNVGEFEYLQSVDTGWDKNAKKFENTFYFTGEEICRVLKEKYDISLENIDLVSKIILNMEENGVYVRSISVGEKVIGSEDFKEIFSLSSTAFSFEVFSDGYKFVTKGIGNGKGLSIFSANSMAKEGKLFDEILSFFYYGIEIKEIL